MKRRLAALAMLLAMLLLPAGCAGAEDWRLPIDLDDIHLPIDLDELRLPFDLPWQSADGDGEDDGLAICRLTPVDPGAAEGMDPEGSLTGWEQCPLPADAGSRLEAAIDLFASPSGQEGLVCALPQGVTVEDWTADNGLVTLRLSDSFLDAGEMDRSAAALCAALTLCRLDGVDAVTVTAADQILLSGLGPEAALLLATDTDPYVRQLRLYFADGEGRRLISEYHSLTLDEDAAADRYVMEELLRGPNSAELRSAIPAGTELLSCQTENGVCTVDLSEPFLTGRPATAAAERLAIYSIVDSLTVLPQVDSVQILVEGQPVEQYVYRSLAQPIGRYEEPIGPVSGLDADLYLPLPGLEAVEPLPWRVTVGEHDSAPEAVLAALLTAAEPGYPALFSGSGTAGSVILRGTSCTVDLSESFFASLPVEDRNIAVLSMAASLCALEEVDRVFFTIGGAPALFDGVDWSGPWTGEGRVVPEMQLPVNS